VTKDLVDDGSGQQEFAFDIPRWDDATLVAGIRRGDTGALREFCERFRPVLLDQARRFRVPSAEREEVVMEFLDDMALKLATAKMPYALPRFVVKSFRHRLIDQWRAMKRMEHRWTEGIPDTPDERILAGTCSEFSRSAAHGTVANEDASEVVTGLVTYLLSQRTASERDMLTWISYHVPLRNVADWLGISYTAAKVRLFRLRAKMHKEISAYLQSIDANERRTLERLLPYDASRHLDLSQAVHASRDGGGHA
jgi:DNA-directed RNA polymerase specialized sigma24 family protein